MEMLQVLDEKGNVNKKLMPKLNNEDIKKMYELMILARVFDETALKLQREGRLGTYASHRGQEASQIGSAMALDSEDWVFPSFRENAALIARGYPMHMLYMYWSGDERGSKIPESVKCFPVSIPVGTQLLHAVGFGWAAKIKRKKIASLVYFGDGATSEGDFHEAMNFAGVFKTPTVFLCQNNQWAISLPRRLQTASETLAQKALSYGFEGVLVDGNDVFAVYKVTKEALEKAKRGEGPTLIECYTYRMENHTTADDARRYRSEEEVKKWEEKDPILRLKLYLQKKNIWNEKYEQNVWSKAREEVNKEVERAESIELPNPEDIINYTFENFGEQLLEQKEYLKKFIGVSGGFP
jgi:pyruvate dehydrogenase E1 component alpha subunit